MSLNIYLTFDGNCRAAFDYYRAAFGGEFSAFMTFADGPPDMDVAEADKDRVMHVSLPVALSGGSSVLMGSDAMSGIGPPPVAGNNFAISINGQSKEHCDAMLAQLSDGGTVTMPLAEMFWGAYFGTWTDRFGINWMINCELPKD